MVIPDDVLIEIALPERGSAGFAGKIYLLGGYCFESPDKAT
jgi:hypothetical protein